MSAVARRAWAMPFTSPSFPRGKFVYKNREYLVLKYRTTKTSLQSVVPEPFELPDEPIAQYEFTRTPDSTGFGSYYSVAQTVPVLFNGVPGKYVHSMFIDDDAPIAAGREVWGFPSRLGTVSLRVEKDAMVGELDIGSVRTVTASSGYKHGVCKTAPNLSVPTFTVKIIPHVDCTPRICQLVQFSLVDVKIHGAWEGPPALSVSSHAFCMDVLPVMDVLSATHIVADSTLAPGRVVKDYLQ